MLVLNNKHFKKIDNFLLTAKDCKDSAQFQKNMDDHLLYAFNSAHVKRNI